MWSYRRRISKMIRCPCCSKGGLNWGKWSAEEDMILSEYIQIHGDGGWTKLPASVGLKRCGKSCRSGWMNYLSPGIKRGNISSAEEELIILMYGLRICNPNHLNLRSEFTIQFSSISGLGNCIMKTTKSTF